MDGFPCLSTGGIRRCLTGQSTSKSIVEQERSFMEPSAVSPNFFCPSIPSILVLPEPFLSSCVPKLQLHLDAWRQLHHLAVELHAYRGAGGRDEAPFGIAPQQRGFAHGGIAQQDDPKLVVPIAIQVTRCRHRRRVRCRGCFHCRELFSDLEASKGAAVTQG